MATYDAVLLTNSRTGRSRHVCHDHADQAGHRVESAGPISVLEPAPRKRCADCRRYLPPVT